MVRTCTCKHEQQDKLHGTGQRVFNPCNKGVRCTVCKAEVLTQQPKKGKGNGTK